MLAGIGPGYISFVAKDTKVREQDINVHAQQFGAVRKFTSHEEYIFTFNTEAERTAFEGVMEASGIHTSEWFRSHESAL